MKKFIVKIKYADGWAKVIYNIEAEDHQVVTDTILQETTRDDITRIIVKEVINGAASEEE